MYNQLYPKRTSGKRKLNQTGKMEGMHLMMKINLIRKTANLMLMMKMMIMIVMAFSVNHLLTGIALKDPQNVVDMHLMVPNVK